MPAQHLSLRSRTTDEWATALFGRALQASIQLFDRIVQV